MHTGETLRSEPGSVTLCMVYVDGVVQQKFPPLQSLELLPSYVVADLGYVEDETELTKNSGCTKPAAWSVGLVQHLTHRHVSGADVGPLTHAGQSLTIKIACSPTSCR